MLAATIDDEGDGFAVALFRDGEQVGGALFPDDGDGSAWELAAMLAEAWRVGAVIALPRA